MVLYSKMSSIFSKDQLFYVTSLPFFAFYTLFAFVLYPNRHIIHPPMPADMDERSLRTLNLTATPATHCNTLQHTAAHCNMDERTLRLPVIRV